MGIYRIYWNLGGHLEEVIECLKRNMDARGEGNPIQVVSREKFGLSEGVKGTIVGVCSSGYDGRVDNVVDVLWDGLGNNVIYMKPWEFLVCEELDYLPRSAREEGHELKDPPLKDPPDEFQPQVREP